MQDLLRSERCSLLQEDRLGERLEGCGRAGCGLCGRMRRPPMTRSSFPGETPGVGSNTLQGGSWKLGRHDGLVKIPEQPGKNVEGASVSREVGS